MQKEIFDEIVAVRRAKCHNAGVHAVRVEQYADNSVWVYCRHFGWYEDPETRIQNLGCKNRKTRCRWFYCMY